MAQYTTNYNIVEAYEIGNATIPDWFTAIYNADKLPYICPHLKGNAADGMELHNADGIFIAHTGDYIIYDATAKTYTVMGGTAFEAKHTLDNADLAEVFSQTDTAPTGGDGLTVATPIIWAIAVPNTTTEFYREDNASTSDAYANFLSFTDADYTVSLGASTGLALTAGTPVHVYFKITSAHATLIKYYDVVITRAEAQ